MFQEIKTSLQQLYREDERPWLVGFSGDVGPSSARPGPKALRPYNDAVLAISTIAEMIEGTLRRMRKCSQQNGLNIDAKPRLTQGRAALGPRSGRTLFGPTDARSQFGPTDEI